ncbi:hypothetical protein I6E29_00885 [Arcanobacterium haemolyticum]|nr:hypothetical protein [Arcanobacterium haemolyticum]
MSDSLLTRMVDQARALGVDPDAPCTDAGMTIALTKADNLGLLVFKPSMAEDWLDSMRLWCHEHRRPPMTFAAIAAAVLQSSVSTDERFIRPRQLWEAVDIYRRAQVRQALAGAHAPAIPDELGGDVTRELAYRRTWTQIAARTGNRQQADALARQAHGITDQPKDLTRMPTQVRAQITQLFREKTS